MTFFQSVHSVFSKYATFRGRASRSEFWYFVLFNFILSAVISIIVYSQIPIETIAASDPEGFYMSVYQSMPGWASTLLSVYTLVLILPSLAVTVRRLHDTGRGGGWIFISIVPIIGNIWYFILMVLPSQQGYNRFGPQPD